MGLDNKGAIAAAFGWKRPNPRWSCYDIVSMIRYHIKNSPIKWTCKHVKGHQDSKMKFEDLDEWGQANVIADQLAKEELRRNRPILQGPLLEGQAWQLSCGDIQIAGDSERQIRNALHEQTMHQRWKTQFGLDEIEEEFNWDAFKRNCVSKPDWQKVWFAKFNARIGSVRTNLVRRKHSEDPTCPCCGELETTEHIYQCKSANMQAAYDVHMEELTSHLRATTSKAITDSIIEVCNATREIRECELDQEWDQTLLDIATVQISAGQRALLGGLWPTR